MENLPSNLGAVVERVRQQAAEGVLRSSLTSYEAGWAVLALQAAGDPAQALVPLRRHLGQWQLDDGRVVVDPATPGVYWPTALATLAWYGDGERFGRHHQRALQFLLRETGAHWERSPRSVSGHDPSIRGWSWLSRTHSWVEPTSLAVIALKASGHRDHARVTEAVRMLLDRQLTTGGWNYGNTTVFDATLRPIPEDTGYALAALAGSVERKEVEESLRYLRSVCETARTPATLAWAIHGLSAWNERPAQAREWIAESLALQERVGVYNVRLVSQLVVSYYAANGLVTWAQEVK